MNAWKAARGRRWRALTVDGQPLAPGAPTRRATGPTRARCRPSWWRSTARGRSRRGPQQAAPRAGTGSPPSWARPSCPSSCPRLGAGEQPAGPGADGSERRFLFEGQRASVVADRSATFTIRAAGAPAGSPPDAVASPAAWPRWPASRSRRAAPPRSAGQSRAAEKSCGSADSAVLASNCAVLPAGRRKDRCAVCSSDL